MASNIPDQYLDLFQKRAFGNLATLMPDGSPQVTPVWIDFDGTHVLVNSARGRQKDKNMQKNARVAISILDPDNPYRYLEVRGTVDAITEEGAEDTYPYRRPEEKRVVFKILPTKTTQMG